MAGSENPDSVCNMHVLVLTPKYSFKLCCFGSLLKREVSQVYVLGNQDVRVKLVFLTYSKR